AICWRCLLERPKMHTASCAIRFWIATTPLSTVLRNRRSPWQGRNGQTVNNVYGQSGAIYFGLMYKDARSRLRAAQPYSWARATPSRARALGVACGDALRAGIKLRGDEAEIGRA